MKSYLSFFVCVTVWALSSCSPKVTSNFIHKEKPLPSLEDVAVYKEKEPLPDDAEWMGSVEVNGNRSYDNMVEIARYEAWEAGGRYVKIKDYSSTGARSDVHLLNTDVYRADNIKRVAVPMSEVASSSEPSVKGQTWTSSTNQTAATNRSDLNTGFESPIMFDPDFTSPNGFRVYTGYGKRLGKMNPDMNEFEQMHLKRMLRGILVGADYVRYFNSSRTCGFGVRYQLMHATSEDYASITFNDGSPSLEGLLSDKVDISYVGPIYSKRFISKDGKNFFMYDVGFGLMIYNYSSSIAGKEGSTHGMTSGVTADATYSHMLSDKLSIGASLSLTSGALTNYTSTDYFGNTMNSSDIADSQAESLLQMGICAQLIYTF
jgi:hypothetical protein